MNNENNKWDWVGTIETSIGKYVNITELEPDMVSLEDIARSLSNICRFNGHVPNFYSVAQHSIFVANWLLGQGYSNEIVLTGLLHDAAEAYVGDMMRPLKRVPAMEAVFKPIEEKAISVIHQVLGGVYPHPKAIHIADRCAYQWEVENIRTGKVVGLAPEIVYEEYIDTYLHFSNHNVSNNVVNTHNSSFIPNNVYTSARRQLLEEASTLVDGDRNAQYGDPIDDFRRTATYWSTHIGGVFRRVINDLGITVDDDVLEVLDRVLEPHDVAIMMGQLKHSRLAWDPYKKDTWTDTAGYAACGYDCVTREI